jgi:glycosyltransferase involved in cell wall biosynthesis
VTHVGLNLMFLVPGASGGRETHVRELLPAMRAAAPDLRITTFLNRETAAVGRGFWSEHADGAMVLRGASGRDRVRWAAAELLLVSAAARRAGVAVLHSPANFGPWHGGFARVLTLHDVGFRTHPELVAPVPRLATELLVVPAARRAHAVITVSRASRAEIVASLGVPADRVQVVPNGISPPRAGSRARGRVRLGNPARPVLLSVATDLAHKNLDGLLAGHALLDPAGAPLLVLVGHGTQARGASGVLGLGAVTPEELEDLYAAADGVITATLYEGFGLPVLEALARGVPVACSDLPVLGEVAGDAALRFDPRDPSGVAGAMRALLAGGPDAERRLALGRKRAAALTWRASAEATVEVYRTALAARRQARLASRFT